MRLSEQVNERLWDSLLSEILKENRRAELAELEAFDASDGILHEFSSEFEKNVRRIRRKFAVKSSLEKVPAAVYKSVATAAAILGIAFAALLTQPKVYAAVGDVIRNVFSDHDSYSYRGEAPKEAFKDNIRPGYMPDGYELYSVIYGGSMATLTYKNEDEEIAIFKYGIAALSSVSIDNERHECKEVERNGKTYFIYEAEETGDRSSVIWYSGEYIYDITAQFDRDELVKIAESVRE